MNIYCLKNFLFFIFFILIDLSNIFIFQFFEYLNFHLNIIKKYCKYYFHFEYFSISYLFNCD